MYFAELCFVSMSYMLIAGLQHIHIQQLQIQTISFKQTFENLPQNTMAWHHNLCNKLNFNCQITKQRSKHFISIVRSKTRHSYKDNVQSFQCFRDSQKSSTAQNNESFKFKHTNAPVNPKQRSSYICFGLCKSTPVTAIISECEYVINETIDRKTYYKMHYENIKQK